MLFVIVTRIQANASKRFRGLRPIRPVSDKPIKGRSGLELTLGLMNSLDIWASDLVKISHARSYRLPGYLFVECVPAKSLDVCARSKTKEALALATVRAENIVSALLNPQKVYVLRFGESSENEHFHIIPRTDALLQKYLSENDDSAPYNGAKITSWLWERSASLGYAERDINDFISRARVHAAA